MELIKLYLSFNQILILLNCLTQIGANNFLQNNFYIYLLSILINWLICFCISKFIQNSIKSEKKEQSKKVEYTKDGFNVKIENKKEILNDQSNIIDKFKIIIIYAIYHHIPLISVNILKYKILKSFKNISILFMVVTYYFLLKEKIYLHHFISLIFIIIFMILSDIFKNNLTENIIPCIIFYSYTGFLKSYVKYIMNDKFVSPYFCSFISTLFLTIKTYLALIINNKNINDKKNLDFKYYDAIIFLICNSLDCLFEHLVLYFFSPFHQIISEIVALFFILNKSKKTIDYIIFFGNMFFIFIYNEIIVLNFFGLGKFTKINIIERGEKLNQKLLQNLEISEISSNTFENIHE